MRATTKVSRKVEKIGRRIVVTTRTTQTPSVMPRRTTTIVTVIANFIVDTSGRHGTPVTTTAITATKKQLNNFISNESGEKSSLSFLASQNYVSNICFSVDRARRVY